MEGARNYSLVILVLAFASILPSLRAANSYEDDEVWRERAELARKGTNDSYEPHPAKIISHLNLHVQR